MPEISRFFGVVIRMFYDDHNPPHFHVEFHGEKAVFDFQGNVLGGYLKSKTATKLVREWVDLIKLNLQKTGSWRRKESRSRKSILWIDLI